ncbi:hypothetical protein [Novosphingobium album (ex Liu et al. 2023)]|nr:hypothetical protein [Novosphingobium album (ex Liu et al. 2023)]
MEMVMTALAATLFLFAGLLSIAVSVSTLRQEGRIALGLRRALAQCPQASEVRIVVTDIRAAAPLRSAAKAEIRRLAVGTRPVRPARLAA